MDAPFLWDKVKKIYPALSIVAPMDDKSLKEIKP